MFLAYVISLNLLGIALLLAINSAEFQLENKYHDYEEITLYFKENENKDKAERIISAIKLGLIICCPLLNTVLGIVCIIFWTDLRNKISLNLDKVYIERRLKYYE